MSTFLAKARHTLRYEGLGSLIDRGARYAAYRARRLVIPRAETVREWAELRGSFAGRRAFLIGNGPSLNTTELYLLEGEATMCFNRFDLMLERLAWNPTFYTVIDDRVLLDTLDVVREVSLVAEHSFFPDVHPYNIDFRRRIEKRDNVHWLFLDRPDFSVDLPYCGINKTVANVGLQILAFLGFTQIYLLGMDMTYSLAKSARIEGARNATATADDDESHFDPRYFGAGRRFHVPMLEEAFAKFREAREFFEARGVQICNATDGGALEEFERVSLDSVLGYSMARKEQMFTKSVQCQLKAPTCDPVRALWESQAVSTAEEVDPEWLTFRSSARDVSRILLKRVAEYVPFGPLDGQVLFVARRALRHCSSAHAWADAGHP